MFEYILLISSFILPVWYRYFFWFSNFEKNKWFIFSREKNNVLFAPLLAHIVIEGKGLPLEHLRMRYRFLVLLSGAVARTVQSANQKRGGRKRRRNTLGWKFKTLLRVKTKNKDVNKANKHKKNEIWDLNADYF